MYPDDFNGCFAACPDSISFEAYATMNIYEDSNAYWCEHNALFVRTLSTRNTMLCQDRLRILIHIDIDIRKVSSLLYK